MSNGRTVGLVALIALAAGGYWLWSSGQWRTLAARVPALAAVAGQQQSVAAAEESPAHQEPVPAPLRVRTWTDENGVVHFEQAGVAPLGARDHAVGTGGTMADYEKALEEKEGITLQDIARAKAARDRAAARAAEDEKARAVADDGGIPGATQQAYELMEQQQAALEKIRNLNNH